MALLIIYLIVNAIIFVWLDRSKYNMRIASVVHAAAFTLVLALVLLAQDGFIGDVMRRLLGDYYDPIHNVLVDGGEYMLSPVMVLEVIIPILIGVVTAVFAAKVVNYVRTRRSAPYVKRESARKTLLFRKAFSPLLLNKIYIRNCVIRC